MVEVLRPEPEMEVAVAEAALDVHQTRGRLLAVNRLWRTGGDIKEEAREIECSLRDIHYFVRGLEIGTGNHQLYDVVFGFSKFVSPNKETLQGKVNSSRDGADVGDLLAKASNIRELAEMMRFWKAEK